jgi:hypothetical protein
MHKNKKFIFFVTQKSGGINLIILQILNFTAGGLFQHNIKK